MLLWFTVLGFWIAWWCRKVTEPIRQNAHPKKLRSWLRIWWEITHQQISEKVRSLIIPEKVSKARSP